MENRLKELIDKYPDRDVIVTGENASKVVAIHLDEVYETPRGYMFFKSEDTRELIDAFEAVYRHELGDTDVAKIKALDKAFDEVSGLSWQKVIVVKCE